MKYAEVPPACPDVIISDVKMPNFSGFGVLNALRRAQVNVPVILMTALRDRSVATVARRLGAADLVLKPLAADELRSAMRRLRPFRGRTPSQSKA